jgi:hypothetical protein
MAPGAFPGNSSRSELLLAAEAEHSGWDPLKRQLGPSGDAVMTEEIEIKLDTVIHHVGHLTNDQDNLFYANSANFGSFTDSDIQDLLSYTQFMHMSRSDPTHI